MPSPGSLAMEDELREEGYVPFGEHEREAAKASARYQPTDQKGGLNETGLEIVQACNEVKALLLDKNQKYGDSALNPVRVFSRAGTGEQLRVRLDDKLSRLARGDAEAETEDVIDDLIGYLILLKIAEARHAE